MPPAVSEEKIAVYRQTARRRIAEREQHLCELRKKAMAVARRAAELLKEKYHVEAVYLFGSLAEKDSIFDEHSDLDLAVIGLDEREYLKVVSRLLDLDPALDVDLVEMENAPASLSEKIKREGIRL